MGVTSTDAVFKRAITEVEEHYKMGVTSTAVALNSKLEKVEEHYKEITIRKCVITDGEQLAEREYKKIKTTKGEVFWLDIKVEGQYKMNVTTTNNQNDFYFEREVEELYNQHTNG